MGADVPADRADIEVGIDVDIESDIESDIDEGDAVPCEGAAARRFAVAPEAQGVRLDKFLADADETLSRTRVKQLMLDGAVSVDGAACADPSRKVRAGSIVTIVVPAPAPDAPEAEDIPLSILYEDADLLVIDKPAGMVVHPAPGHRSGTLVNALLHHCGDSLSGIGGVRRPGIVHRLDKDTSGLMLVAKNDRAHQALSGQLADRSLSRRYFALVWGVPQAKRGRVDKPVGRHPQNRQKMAVTVRGGREAATRYECREIFHGAASLVECSLETGRTHQVRVHMAHIGHPLVGDPVYGAQATAARALLKKAGYEAEEAAAIMAFSRQALHAWRISFVHPGTGAVMHFETPVPADFRLLLNSFKTSS